MDPYLHTIIAVVMLYVFFKVGEVLGRVAGYKDGAAEGAENLISILDEQGDIKRERIYYHLEKWVEQKSEE
jgi:hypothetical protein